jgi:predicted deacylase
VKPALHHWDVPVGHRVGAEPWKIRFLELRGAQPGPVTAVVAGIFGDKPLGCLAVHALAQRLQGLDIRGTVVLVPAANPPALEAGTRLSPDGLFLNRRFPGAPTGPLTDQIAHHLLAELRARVDAVVDLHSGTPTMALHYTYDYGDRAFTAAFGYMPVIVGYPHEGQLSVAATRAGMRSSLPEFGGGPFRDVTIGVEGCLNVLRYRGHLDGPPTGPRRVQLVERITFFSPSTTGVLRGSVTPERVGQPIEPGVLGWIEDPATGERVEEFAIAEPALLLLADQSPRMVAPGAFAFMVGYPSGEIDVPAR